MHVRRKPELNYVELKCESRWANVTIGLSCQVENTAYIAYTGTNEFIDVVSR